MWGGKIKINEDQAHVTLWRAGDEPGVPEKGDRLSWNQVEEQAVDVHYTDQSNQDVHSFNPFSWRKQ